MEGARGRVLCAGEGGGEGVLCAWEGGGGVVRLVGVGYIQD